MSTSDGGGHDELKRRLRRCTAALAGDTKNPALLSEMADVLTFLGRAAESVSFRLNAAKCFQGKGQLAEAATSCDLALLEEPDHHEAKALRGKLPDKGVPIAALTMDLPAMEDPPDGYLIDDEPPPSGLRRHPTLEVDEQDVLESSAESFDPELPTTRHVPVMDDPDERPTTRHQPVLTPMGWGMMEGEEEVIELREPARKGRSNQDTGPLVRENPLEPTSQPLVIPDDFRAQGELRTYAVGDVLLTEQEQSTDLLLLTEGKVEVLKETWAHQPGRNRHQRLSILEAESCLGELSLLGDGRRHATVKALEPSKALVFTKGQIKELMRSNADVNRAIRRLYRRRLQDTLLRFSSLFQALPPEVARAFLARCKPRRVEPDKIVVKEGNQASGVYVVLLGLLDVSSSHGTNEGEAILLHRLSDGDFFGGISHILKQLSPGSVRTRSFVQLLYISPPDFDELTQEHPIILDVMREEAERRSRSYHSIIAGEAQYEVGTFVYLLEKKKGSEKEQELKATGWGDEE